MIELQTETLLTLKEAAERIPGSPHLSTLYRWVRAGLKGVILESCLVGGRRVTSIEAVNRFASAITERVDRKKVSGSPRMPSDASHATAEIDKAGF